MRNMQISSERVIHCNLHMAYVVLRSRWKHWQKLKHAVFKYKTLTLPINDAVPRRLDLDAGRVTLTLTVPMACTNDAMSVLPLKPDILNGTSERNEGSKKVTVVWRGNAHLGGSQSHLKSVAPQGSYLAA